MPLIKRTFCVVFALGLLAGACSDKKSSSSTGSSDSASGAGASSAAPASSDGSGGASSSSGGGASTTVQASIPEGVLVSIDTCALVTKDEVAQLFGATDVTNPQTAPNCVWDVKSKLVRLVVSQTLSPSSKDTLTDDLALICDSPTTVNGIGDYAVRCASDTIAFLVGQRGIGLDAPKGGVDDPSALEALAKVAAGRVPG